MNKGKMRKNSSSAITTIIDNIIRSSNSTSKDVHKKSNNLIVMS